MNVYLTDFYQDWLIEVVQIEGGFSSICYSPYWEQIKDDDIYPSLLEAMRAAKQEIDRHVACHSLIHLLRELYEAQRLEFEEWQSLSHFLARPSRIL